MSIGLPEQNHLPGQQHDSIRSEHVGFQSLHPEQLQKISEFFKRFISINPNDFRNIEDILGSGPGSDVMRPIGNPIALLSLEDKQKLENTLCQEILSSVPIEEGSSSDVEAEMVFPMY